jgi:hypothetical protein
MITLILGFVCLVMVPAILLALIMNRLINRSDESFDKEDDLKFTM